MEAHRYASYPGKNEISRKKHIFARFHTDTPLSGKYTQNQWNNKNFDGKGVTPNPPAGGLPSKNDPKTLEVLQKWIFEENAWCIQSKILLAA